MTDSSDSRPLSGSSDSASPDMRCAPDRPGASAPGAPVYILGLGLPLQGAGQEPLFAAISHPVLARADVLVGGAAQIKPFKDFTGETLLVGKDVQALYSRIKANREAGKIQVLVCSGDPLFFGLGARLAEFLGPEALRIVPAVSTLQAAAAFLGLPWETVRPVSLHGRSAMLPLAHAVIKGGPVFILPDRAHSPSAIAGWMLERGRWRYTMHILESLFQTADGAVQAARHERLSLSQARAWSSE